MGVPGLVATHCGAKQVVLTDISERVLACARYNAEANEPPQGVGLRAQVAHFDWGEPPLRSERCDGERCDGEGCDGGGCDGGGGGKRPYCDCGGRMG